MIPNLFGNVFAKIINAFLSLIVLVIFSRLLGPAGNGIFSLFIVNSSLAILVFGFGLENAITFFVAQDGYREDKIINTSILLSLLQTLLALGLVLLIDNTFSVDLLNYSNVSNSNFGWLVAGSYLFISFLYLYLMAFFNGKQAFKTVNKAMKYTQVFAIGTYLFAGSWLKENGGTETLINSYLLIQMIGPAYILWQYFSTINKRHTFVGLLNKLEMKPIIQFGLFALVINLIQFLAFRADIWILDFYSNSKETVGTYGLSQRLIQMYWMVPIAIASITYPMLSKTGNLSASLLTQTTKIIIQIWFYLSLIILLLAPYFIVLIFGKSYKDSVAPFLILIPGALLFVFAVMLSPYFSAKNKLIKNFWVSMLCLSSILILDLILIPIYGINGAAIASSIGYALAGIFSLYFYCRMENLKIVEFFKRTKNFISTINTTILGR